jgi:hypothetical protein
LKIEENGEYYNMALGDTFFMVNLIPAKVLSTEQHVSLVRFFRSVDSINGFYENMVLVLKKLGE